MSHICPDEFTEKINDKKIEASIQQLRTMNFKYHVIHSVIYIVPLCGKNDRIGKKNPEK